MSKGKQMSQHTLSLFSNMHADFSLTCSFPAVASSGCYTSRISSKPGPKVSVHRGMAAVEDKAH